MQISIKSDFAKLQRDLLLDQRQVPYAASIAINDCLKLGDKAVEEEMKRVFDRPTRWTLNSYRVLKWSKKTDLTGVVGFKDVDYKGGPGGGPLSAAGVYLQPHMDGGPRSAKRLEVLLRARGLISSGEFLVPSQFVKLDQYGNVPRGTVQKMLANLQASFDPYTRTPSGGARGGKKKADYFFTRRGVRGQRLTAIWQNFGAAAQHHAVPAMIVVTSAPQYKKRFDHVMPVQRVVDQNFRQKFDISYARAIAMRKP